MNQPETILLSLPLPEFANKFKQNCISPLLALIDTAIEALETTTSPVLYILMIILFVQLVRLALVHKNNLKQKQDSPSNTSDIQMTTKQIKDLKKQLKSLQKTVQELKQLGFSKDIQGQHDNRDQITATQKIIKSCRQSWQKRQGIADHILEYQTKLMQQVKKIKSKSRLSSASKVPSSISKQSAIKSRDNYFPNTFSSVISPVFNAVEENNKNNKIQHSSQLLHPINIKFEEPIIPNPPKIKNHKIEIIPKPVEKNMFIAPLPSDSTVKDKIQIQEQQIDKIVENTPSIIEQTPTNSQIYNHQEEIVTNQEDLQPMKIENEPTSLQTNQAPPIPSNRPFPPKPIRPPMAAKAGRQAPPPPPIKKS